MERWGRLMARRRWAVLVVGLVAIVAAGAWGLGVFGALSAAGFEDPDSESARAEAQVVAEFGPVDADLLVLYTGAGGVRVDDLAFEQAVSQTIGDLPATAVVSAATTYDGGGAGLVSTAARRRSCPLPSQAPTMTSERRRTSGSRPASRRRG